MELRFRRETKGPEADLVRDFLRNKDVFLDENLEYEILIETYAEVGIPDIIIVGWDRSKVTDWPENRNDLKINDLKIMHHISSFRKRGITFKKLEEQLGFSKKNIQKSISTLEKAELIKNKGDRVYANNLESVFFIKQIITIEAKMKNWKDALHQAQLNENFSSHSYVLLPEKIINHKVKSTFTNKIGLLAHNGDRVIFKKKARKNTLPSSYYSWVINEHIGRKHFDNQ